MGGILRGLGIGNNLGGGFLGSVRGLGGVAQPSSPFVAGQIGQMLAKRTGEKKKRKPGTQPPAPPFTGGTGY